MPAARNREVLVVFHRRAMYNRPEDLWLDFIVEAKTDGPDERGRVHESYNCSEPVYIRAVLCGASPEQQLLYRQISHPVSHVISHEGAPIAKAGDRLVNGNRVFYVQGVDCPGDLGIWTLYYCEEKTG